MKFIGISKRKIQRYLMKKWKRFLKNLILIKPREINFFMSKLELMKNYFCLHQQQDKQKLNFGKQEQSVLVQKIANLVGTGNDNVSYKRAIDRINRRQLDEIGTEKSREKPINILQRKIEYLENEKKEFKKYENIIYEIEENKNNLKNEINNLENENNLLKEIKLISDKENIEKEKIKIKENIKNENNEKINIIKKEIIEIKNNNKNILELNTEKIKNNKKINKEKNKINKKLIIFFILINLMNILQFIFVKNKLINFIFILTVPTYLIFCFLIKNKLNKKIKKEEEIEKNNLINLEKIKNEINNKENEKEILENNNINLENEINNSKNNLLLKINLEKEKIKNNYLNKIEKNKLNNLINEKNINFEIENLQNEISNKKIKLTSIELERKNTNLKLENLSKIEEELVNNKEKSSTLQKINLSFQLAKEILEQSYEKMRNTVTPKFTQELSKSVSEITDGKYNKIMFNDEVGLIIELGNGNYVPASKLSIGTIDQLYLSLRLSMAEELSKENLPIILDEAFAYYDEERLENILKYINKKFNNHQIIIFTCTNREKEVLEKNNIEYNYIKL